MIGFVDGEVIHAGEGLLTVLAGVVGYEIRVPEPVAMGTTVGTRVRLWTHLAVRDQGWELFGFANREERDLFRILQKVPQVGARTAQAILGVFRAPTLIRVVSEGDVTALTSVPGIGKKTAQRILVELRDRMLTMDPAGAGADGEPGGPGRDAVQALVGLGYGHGEAQRLVVQAIEAGSDGNDVEALIRAVLVQGEA